MHINPGYLTFEVLVAICPLRYQELAEPAHNHDQKDGILVCKNYKTGHFTSAIFRTEPPLRTSVDEEASSRRCVT